MQPAYAAKARPRKGRMSPPGKGAGPVVRAEAGTSRPTLRRSLHLNAGPLQHVDCLVHVLRVHRELVLHHPALLVRRVPLELLERCDPVRTQGLGRVPGARRDTRAEVAPELPLVPRVAIVSCMRTFSMSSRYAPRYSASSRSTSLGLTISSTTYRGPDRRLKKHMNPLLRVPREP